MVVRNKESQLIALCDVRPKEKLGISNYKVPFYGDHIKMLHAHPEVDVVCICTPNGLHSDMAIDTINSDKHVVIDVAYIYASTGFLKLSTQLEEDLINMFLLDLVIYGKIQRVY